METQPAAAIPAPLPKRTNPILLLLLAILVAGVIGAALWMNFYHAPVVDQSLNLRATGFNGPVIHKLAPEFTDSDGDLIADAPTDPAKWIDPPTICFSYVATDDAEASAKNWKPFTDYLSQQLGKPVEYLPVTSTHDELKALHDGRLQVAGLNTGSVPTAVNLCGFVPVCAVPTADGSATTHTDIIVPADSPIQKPSDLKGHDLTLTAPDSNSGYKAPLVLLRSDFDLQPMSDLHLRFSNSHDLSIQGIASRKYEAAAVADDMLSRQLASGGISADKFRTIYQSESFPTAGLGYVYNLKPDLAGKIRAAMMSFNWKGTPLEKVLNSEKSTSFVPVNYKNDWSLIRRIDDEMGTENKY
jgi:phosphonate transport system substrate-binding protein